VFGEKLEGGGGVVSCLFASGRNVRVRAIVQPKSRIGRANRHGAVRQLQGVRQMIHPKERIENRGRQTRARHSVPSRLKPPLFGHSGDGRVSHQKRSPRTTYRGRR